MALRTVGVRLTAEVTGFVARMKAAERSVKTFHQELQNKASAGHMDDLADRAGIMGLGLAAGFGYAVKASAEFDKQMSAVSAATNATAGDLKKLRAAALDAGKNTQYSATQAAKGVTELGKAGVATDAILSGGLKGALALAAAGQLDVGEAAETAASAMTQFKLSGDQVPHVADLLAAAAGKAQGSVHDMGQALNQAGLVAAQTGLSIEETTGGLAAFASAGLTGSDAGTSFKQMLLMLQAPSGKTQKLMDELGISLYDSQGKFIGLSKFAGQLQDKLKGLTPQARAAAMAQIFGADATRAASIMYEQGAAGVQKWITKVDDAGYAQKTAAKLTDNLAGDLERLKGSLETMAIEAGSGANGGLRILVQGLGKLVDLFGALPSGVSATLTVLAGVGGVLLLAAAAWVKLRRGIAETAEELRKVGPAGETAARGLERGSKMAGRAALAFAALEAVSLGIKALTDNAPNVERLTKAIDEFGKTGKVTGELSEAFGENADDLSRVAQFAGDADHGFWQFFNTVQSGIPILGDLSDAFSQGVFGTSFNDATEKMKALDDALVQSMINTKDATKASELWAKTLARSGQDTAELAKQLPNAYAKVGEMNGAAMKAKDSLADLGTATKGVTSAQEKYATAADAAAGAMRGERAAFTELSTAMKAETDPVFGLISAQEQLAKAQKAASKAVKDHGRNSVDAKDAYRNLALAAITLQEKAGGVSSSFNGKMSPALRATLKAAKLTDAQIAELGKQFTDAKKKADKYDGDYKANITAPGAKKAKDDIDKAYTAANGFAGPYLADIRAPGAKQAKKEIDLAYTAANGFAGPYLADLKAPGAKKSEAQIADAWAQAKGFNGSYKAKVTVSGDMNAAARLIFLNKLQDSLKKGTSVGNARALAGDAKAAADRGLFHGGGYTGSGSKYEPAGVVHRDEFVIRKEARRQFEAENPGALDHLNQHGTLPGYAAGGSVWPYRTNAKMTRIPSQKSIEAAAMPSLGGGGNWPSSPSAQRGDSGVWRTVKRWLERANLGGSFGNGYRPGDPKWHGSGRAVDWMGFEQDALATRLAAMRPLELIHRTNRRDYAYTRGKNKGSFNNALMQAHRNHVHIAMANGGVINEHVVGFGRSGATYEFGEKGPERVIPGYASGGLVSVAPGASPSKRTLHASTDEAVLAAAAAVQALTDSLKANGRSWKTTTAAGRENRSSLLSGIKAAQAAAQAKFEETGSVRKANATYDQYLRMLDASLKKMGVNAKGRRDLLKAYSERPKFDLPTQDSSSRISATQAQMGANEALDSAKKAFAWTKPTFDSRTDTGRAELSELFSYLGAAKAAAQTSFDFNGDAKAATKIYTDYLVNLKAILRKSGMAAAEISRLFELFGKITLDSKANRWGGLYEHAADGALKEALIAGAGTRYAWAEPSTGGELFAPKHGNIAKTRSQVGWAVQNWWGGQVAWGGNQPAGRVMTVNATIPITLGSETITRQVRIEVDTALGQVAAATVYQTA